MPATRAEAVAAMSRDELPADAQWTRAFAAVALGLIFACSFTRQLVNVPGVRSVTSELRVLAGVPCLVIRNFTGVF